MPFFSLLKMSFYLKNCFSFIGLSISINFMNPPALSETASFINSVS